MDITRESESVVRLRVTPSPSFDDVEQFAGACLNSVKPGDTVAVVMEDVVEVHSTTIGLLVAVSRLANEVRIERAPSFLRDRFTTMRIHELFTFAD